MSCQLVIAKGAGLADPYYTKQKRRGLIVALLTLCSALILYKQHANKCMKIIMVIREIVARIQPSAAVISRGSEKAKDLEGRGWRRNDGSREGFDTAIHLHIICCDFLFLDPIKTTLWHFAGTCPVISDLGEIYWALGFLPVIH